MNDNKKILIVCKSFYPENSPRSHRATELAKEFARQGHNVTVVTPKKPEVHIQFEQQYQLNIKDLGTPRWRTPDFGKSKIGYLLTRAFIRFFQLGFEYPAIELMFLVKKWLKQENSYDLLISIAVPYPIHWGIARVRNKKRPIAKTWIADCGDPYMGCDTDTFNKPFYFKYVEKWFMKKADFITIPVESSRAAYYKEFHPKIRIIPQGFNIESIESVAYKKNSVPTFAYAGGFIPGIRDPRPFLRFLSEIESDFRFYIYTNQKDILEPLQSSMGEKLRVNSYIPREQLLNTLTGMDFLVNFDNNTGLALPSKLIDYKIVNRPVLNIKKTLDKELILQFLNGQYSNAMIIGDVDQYRIENVCYKFLALVNEQK